MSDLWVEVALASYPIENATHFSKAISCAADIEESLLGMKMNFGVSKMISSANHCCYRSRWFGPRYLCCLHYWKTKNIQWIQPNVEIKIILI